MSNRNFFRGVSLRRKTLRRRLPALISRRDAPKIFGLPMRFCRHQDNFPLPSELRWAFLFFRRAPWDWRKND
jgi:hypothetical protein